MKSKSSKKTSKKKSSKSSSNNGILTLTHYNSLKPYIPFIIGILLLSVIYWVYKKYNTQQEGFLEQEPVDLLDRIKDNSYISLPMWSNFLYNYQKGLEETPLTFWKLNRDDNTFKFIGNAISNDVNEITGIYTPTKQKTMLVQGDTKVPESAKLLFQHPYNLITTREEDSEGALRPVNVYKKIDNLKDIDDRIEQLTEAYKLLIQVKKELTDRFKNKIDYISNKINFNVSLFGLNNYFSKSIINSNVKLNGSISLGNGKYNGIRIPIGAKVKMTFTNGTILNYVSNIDNILNESKTAFKKITTADLFDHNVDQSIFNKLNFNIFGPYGLTKPINNPEENNDNPNYKRVKNVTRISRRKGDRDDISAEFEYPFNYTVSNNKNYDAVSFYGKEAIATYITKLINEQDNRNNYIDSNTDNISNTIMYVGKLNNSSGPLASMYYLFNSPLSNTERVARHPNVDSNGDHYVIWKDRNDNDNIEFENASGERMENITEGFRLMAKKGKKYAITNPMIDVDTEFINDELILGDILELLVVKLNSIKNESKGWGADLEDIRKQNGSPLKIDSLYDFDYNNELGLDADTQMFIPGGTESSKKINIKMPYFYLNFVFKYPEFIYEGNLKFKESRLVRNAFSGLSWNFTNSRRHRNNRWIFLNTIFNGYRNCHDVDSIKGDDVFLKNVNVSMDLSESQLPFKNILNRVLELKLQELQYFEQTLVNMTNKLNNLRSQILAGEYKHYPMKIYRPIAPKYYKSVGDILITLNSYSVDNDYIAFESEPNLQEYACVPEQCVREIREWLPIDKVYEYQQGSKYLALYKNPYLQTFRAVTTPGVLPPGKVEKIVACVDRCKLVDDLIQADKCARILHKAHKNVSDTFNLDPDNLLHERKSNIYKNKIVEREDRLNTLKEVARRLQVQDDKANMINKAYNRHRLQELVDKQKVNMHTLVDKLDKGKNKIVINVKFDYDKASGTLNNLCNNNSLPPAVCKTLNQVLDTSARRALELEGAERLQYDKQALDALLRSCPTPDMENLFKRSLVESNCGCYFTDEELETN